MEFQEIAAYPDAGVLEKYKEFIDTFRAVFASVNSEELFLKESKEKTKQGSMLFCPRSCNRAIKAKLREHGWKPHKHKFRYRTGNQGHGSYEVDFYKDRIACELQFGKYSFMPDNVMKLEIFYKHLQISDLGVLIVPSKDLQSKMSTGPGCIEQIVQRLDDLKYNYPLVVIGLGA